MLKLSDIHKSYTAGDSTVEALRGVSLSFRRHEFVSILGPSGCGKTTLLNIIGGLDRYTAGDLSVNGRSTASFKDRDWDTYRNHTIGFVFQSYNLIPHQSVLANVELALTLSGVSRAERRRRATEALGKVGLADQLHKKPNQMSGGQMQRVAIARALVNDPEILLADEPTGALDSATSVQIMEILKEISANKLIIMVTHNPELAAKYSSRIVRLLDGQVVSDTDPYTEEAPPAAPPTKKGRKEHTSMSFLTALSLSTDNLLTKKARTLLTAFAGSIGIIGIALILALSSGINAYINAVQEDTLSSYPLTLEAENVDLSSLITTLAGVGQSEADHEKDAVYANAVMYKLMNSMNTVETNKNDLAAFKTYLETDGNAVTAHATAIQYAYGKAPAVYAKDPDGEIVRADITDMMQRLRGDKVSSTENKQTQNPFAAAMPSGSGMQLFEELLTDSDGKTLHPLLSSQYDLVYGHWPEKYDELVLVVDENNEVQDVSLYALGLKTTEELKALMKNEGSTTTDSAQQWSYEDICSRSFSMVLPADCWQYDKESGKYVDLTATAAGRGYLYDNGLTLKITGIIRPNADATASMLTGSIGYTAALTDYIAEKSAASPALAAQLADRDTDVFTGLPFKTDSVTEPTADEKAAAFRDYAAALPTAEKATLYGKIAATPSAAYLNGAVENVMKDMTRAKIEAAMADSYSAEMGVSADTVRDYVAGLSDDELFAYVRDMLKKQLTADYAAAAAKQLESLPAAQLAAMLDAALPTYDADALVTYYDSFMPPTVSDATLDENLKTLGYIDKENPTAINIYAATFADKDAISDAIAAYNDSVAQEQKISYTDYVALMMSSITTIISAISYVLIAFVAISLVVSSIMIGIITYISVLERTKEIGVLRAIGASKRDISRVFNAETLIVGFAAGAIGIGITLLLCIPINAVIRSLTGIAGFGAALPWQGGVILVAISMFLTFIAGLIPARVAAKKDPVVALRTE